MAVQLTQSDAEKVKQTEMVSSLTEALNKELTKVCIPCFLITRFSISLL